MSQACAVEDRGAARSACRDRVLRRARALHQRSRESKRRVADAKMSRDIKKKLENKNDEITTEQLSRAHDL